MFAPNSIGAAILMDQMRSKHSFKIGLEQKRVDGNLLLPVGVMTCGCSGPVQAFMNKANELLSGERTCSVEAYWVMFSWSSSGLMI